MYTYGFEIMKQNRGSVYVLAEGWIENEALTEEERDDREKREREREVQECLQLCLCGEQCLLLN